MSTNLDEIIFHVRKLKPNAPTIGVPKPEDIIEHYVRIPIIKLLEISQGFTQPFKIFDLTIVDLDTLKNIQTTEIVPEYFDVFVSGNNNIAHLRPIKKQPKHAYERFNHLLKEYFKPIQQDEEMKIMIQMLEENNDNDIQRVNKKKRNEDDFGDLERMFDNVVIDSENVDRLIERMNNDILNVNNVSRSEQLTNELRVLEARKRELERQKAEIIRKRTTTTITNNMLSRKEKSLIERNYTILKNYLNAMGGVLEKYLTKQGRILLYKTYESDAILNVDSSTLLLKNLTHVFNNPIGLLNTLFSILLMININKPIEYVEIEKAIQLSIRYISYYTILYESDKTKDVLFSIVHFYYNVAKMGGMRDSIFNTYRRQITLDLSIFSLLLKNISVSHTDMQNVITTVLSRFITSNIQEFHSDFEKIVNEDIDIIDDSREFRLTLHTEDEDEEMNDAVERMRKTNFRE